jgi:hypothetical protein
MNPIAPQGVPYIIIGKASSMMNTIGIIDFRNKLNFIYYE